MYYMCEMEQMIHKQVVEACYISDDSGTVLEIINRIAYLPQDMVFDWE